MRPILTKADADSIRKDIEMVYDDWFANAERIDWENFLDRIESLGYDLGDQEISPAMRRMRQIVRELQASG